MSTMTMMNHNIPTPVHFGSNGIPIPTTSFTALTNASSATSSSSSNPTPITATSSSSAVSSSRLGSKKRGSLARTNKASAFSRRVSTESALRDEKPRCKQMLPEDFVPTPYTVVCGRGRKCTTAVGNRRLQVIATMFIPKYSQCRRKEDKTEIVSQILAMVKSACPDEGHAFVKYHEGRWWEVETLIAREKIGAVLRDCLHDKYRSSTKSKLERRRLQKLKDREDAEDEGNDSDNNNIQQHQQQHQRRHHLRLPHRKVESRHSDHRNMNITMIMMLMKLMMVRTSLRHLTRRTHRRLLR
mmetsp:Transcript_3936/g.9565  ORF Transcript_3936/g.9565 Transcript_3936/m.9565 type:complete len:299 (-) Transcript_3936:3892-4788(-)